MNAFVDNHEYHVMQSGNASGSYGATKTPCDTLGKMYGKEAIDKVNTGRAGAPLQLNAPVVDGQLDSSAMPAFYEWATALHVSASGNCVRTGVLVDRLGT